MDSLHESLGYVGSGHTLHTGRTRDQFLVSKIFFCLLADVNLVQLISGVSLDVLTLGLKALCFAVRHGGMAPQLNMITHQTGGFPIGSMTM